MAIFAIVVAVVGYLGSWWLKMPYWIAASIVAAALLINGLIAILEDRRDLPPD